MSKTFDVAIIGGGIAGASIAAELSSLSGELRIMLAEGEEAPGYHTTGRSAAFWEECYGGPDVAPLTLASGSFLRDGGFLNQRGALYIARRKDDEAVESFLQKFAGTGVTIERLGRSAIQDLVPGLREEWLHAIRQPHCADIDVGALHQHFLRKAKRNGARLKTRHLLRAAEREGSNWRLDFGEAGEVRAAVIVNAAGAWADDVAQICGVPRLGITPLRRTVVQLRTALPVPATMPLVLDLAGSFYFKPENGRIWLSPHDETPSVPCDAAAEELDVALAIDRLGQAVDWEIEAVERKWAGLRSFARDRRPVYGFDGQQEGFFWCAGQGGFGIQTSPAAARLAAQILLGAKGDAMTQALDRALYSPARFS